MSSPEIPPDSPMDLPEAGNDVGDPNVPSEDQRTPTPPIANPTRDMEAGMLSDDDLSDLSDVDEAQFADFDPANIAIEDRPAVAIDEDNIALIGRHKRKRVEGEEADAGKKKKKEAKRDKKKKRFDEDENFSGGEELHGKRRRKKAVGEDGDDVAPVRQRRQETPDEELDEETRRRRELDRRMDAALKNPNRSRRRKHDGIDVANNLDEEAKNLYEAMQTAAEADNNARTQSDPPQPALQKLKLLPDVVAFLNRTSNEMENAIADNNVLEGVRFFLEPLGDGSLPAYNIQRELFSVLAKLPIGKDTLISSGLGKVVIFYTKSKKVQPEIVRQADRLLSEWTRPILKRSDNYRNRALETRVYDPSVMQGKSKSARGAVAETAEERRKRELALPRFQNRARVDLTQKSYSIVPMSQAPIGQGVGRQSGGDDAFKRIKARHAASQRATQGLRPKKKGNAI